MNLNIKSFQELVYDEYTKYNGKVAGILIHPATWSIIVEEDRAKFFQKKLYYSRRTSGWKISEPKKFIGIPVFTSEEMPEDNFKIILKEITYTI